jgi:hypothetical protein
MPEGDDKAGGVPALFFYLFTSYLFTSAMTPAASLKA